jgi:hypothetical protein
MILYGEMKDGDEIAISSEAGVLIFNDRPQLPHHCAIMGSGSEASKQSG